jgi:hypothetical protein
MSDPPTETAITVRDSMAGIARVETADDYVRLTTHCMYPSNGFVRVFVRLSGETAIISDDHGALNEAQSAGLKKPYDSQLRHVVRPFGAAIRNGNVFRMCAVSDISPIAIFVANASQALAHWLYTHQRIRPTRDFRALLTDMLERKFESLVHKDVEIDGEHKRHRFANLVALPNGRRLIVDPVAPDAASINARIVAHLDVRNLRNPALEQRIIYDDTEEWEPASLSLLSVGANAVAFSNSAQVFDKIAAYA